MNREATSNSMMTIKKIRAALLLGLSEQELWHLSSESGLGLRETADGVDEIFFTYEDLRQICVLATQHVH